jgi:predicted protein tyrosine phosphatase
LLEEKTDPPALVLFCRRKRSRKPAAKPIFGVRAQLERESKTNLAQRHANSETAVTRKPKPEHGRDLAR